MTIGMKAMVTQNIITDLDITNGARGTIVDYGYTWTSQLTGLGVIPMEPATQRYRISCQSSEGSVITRTVRRFPMTVAYAFTDYRSQGQTLRHPSQVSTTSSV